MPRRSRERRARKPATDNKAPFLFSNLSLSLFPSFSSLFPTFTTQQGQAGAARLLAELAAAQAERDALASDAAALKAAAERAEAEEGSNSNSGGGSCLKEKLLRLRRPPGAASPPPPPQATFLFDDLDLGPPAGASGGSRNAVAF
jgi:hypothetical protein